MSPSWDQGTVSRFTDLGVDIVTTRLDVARTYVRDLEALLSEDERDRAERFVFDRDRRRFIVARARLRELLASRLDIRSDSVPLTTGVHGKPALAPGLANSELRFNVSHCDDLAVYAFASEREIGVDVELVRDVPDTDGIAARFFSPRERETYRALAPEDRTVGFFNCWTRKEAFIKAVGDGLAYPLDRFDVSLTPDEPAAILRVEEVPGDRCGWRMRGFVPVPGFVAAVVIATR